MAINNNQKLTKGMSVIEILVAIFVLLVAFSGIAGLLAFSLQVSNLNKETIYANFLAQETLDATRNFRDGTSWATNGLGILTVGNPYHPAKTVDNPPKWSMVLGEEIIGNFTRKVVLENVNRDSNDNIVATDGTLDPLTKKAKVTVSWKNKKVEITTYFTNWK
jgi:type II secretory pathway pseudopilin PulG